MNKYLLFLLSLCISACSNLTLAQSKSFAEFSNQRIGNKMQLLKIWGKPSKEMDFNLIGKKYLYLRYTNKQDYPIADFTVDLKDNSVVESLYYPNKDTKHDFKNFIGKHFKNIIFEKNLDSCSHHDQFIHYNKIEGIIAFSHQLLGHERSLDLVGYSTPEMIEKRLLANKTQKCGFKK